MPTNFLVAIDTGGTFTDFVFVDAEGNLTVSKLSSSPRDPSESILAGLKEAQQRCQLGKRFDLTHGTTVATNALLERRGARTALITTQGFRDVLEIGRQSRRELYALHPGVVEPLLARNERFELPERVDWMGRILTPLAPDLTHQLLARLKADGVESVAVCLLFSYLNPAHERQIGKAALACGMNVSLSSEIAPEPREYERSATTAANAFVAPVLGKYLANLERRAREAGADRIRLMQSNGGTLSVGEAVTHAIKTALSGPAGGVVASAAIGKAAGVTDLLTFDMGGTSTDVALLRNGRCPVVTDGTLGALPLRTPMLDIHTVGAGGGSIARLDLAGALRVGPQSAGADPGPVAYGRGEQLTVTDANLLLGRLPSNALLAGRVPLDPARVKLFMQSLAQRMGCSVERAAVGIIDIANAAMARALRHISTERGQDPAEYTLLSFGGAGGLHACALAESLGMRAVLVPRYPGAFSALGLALADRRREYVRSLPSAAHLRGQTTDWNQVTRYFDALERQAASEMEGDGIGETDWYAERLLDMRYAGQAFDLRVPLPNEDLSTTPKAFHDAHLARYGYADPTGIVEVVAVRLIAVAPTERRQLRVEVPDKPASPRTTVRLHDAMDWQEATLYLRAELALGQQISGPALVVQPDATLYLAAGWCAVTEEAGNLRLTKRGKDG